MFGVSFGVVLLRRFRLPGTNRTDGLRLPFYGFYEWTYANVHVPSTLADLLQSWRPHMPFHRAEAGHGLQEYVVHRFISGALHIFIGYILGLVNVYKAHGVAAAYFEKGSWLLILGWRIHAVFKYGLWLQ